jgi:hypothetical protein
LETYAVELERRAPWWWVAHVSLIRNGDAVPLIDVRALSSRGARRRAARFISVRGELSAPRSVPG